MSACANNPVSTVVQWKIPPLKPNCRSDVKRLDLYLRRIHFLGQNNRPVTVRDRGLLEQVHKVCSFECASPEAVSCYILEVGPLSDPSDTSFHGGDADAASIHRPLNYIT